ncbi:phage tail protein [Rickettsia endosymbiont of Oedothorax gibbosus]|uniref:hypothetical protein n=1 Tax=Rickettsia endosymbiont of Oedothorax gibbosus TaxID=931099 RepID=UPI00202571C5|nr:hypothetical protein [Rickettsia endosymbiont of Oedothorax gibbosus]
MQQEQFVYSQKNNFSGGELTPTIEGRTELVLYQNGVKKLINFMLLPSGGIMRRHGTQFVHLFNDNVPKKMAAVMFSRKLSYLLVFESHKLHTNCLFFVGGELLLTNKIIKDDGQDFHFRPKDFSYVVFQGIAYISFGDKRPIFKFSVDPQIVEQFYQYISEQASKRQVEYGERAEIASSSSYELSSNFPGKDRMFIIEPLKCQVNYFTTGQTGQATKIQKPFNEVIYGAEVDKINDELKALYQRAASLSYVNQSPIYQAQQEKLYCTSVVTFENRLWCFGVNKNIHAIWASYKGDFSDFRMAYRTLLEARNPLTAFSATFSSATFDNVLWSVPFADELLLGTSDGIYLVKEGDRAKGEFVKIHKEIELPVSPLKPVVIGKTIFFVEGNGCKINSLYYSQEKGGFQISDITAYAEHIFAGGIRQIVGCNSPFSMIVAVLKNGSFAIFIYSQDLKIMGWSQHWLGGNGQVLGITPIYAESADMLYLHVRRSDDTGVSSKEYLEVLQTRYFSAKHFVTDRAVYADCHVNILQPGENAAYRSIMQALKDDSAYEFRGDITKLEHIVQAQAENILRVKLDNAGDSFKYKNRHIANYDEHRPEIESFLQKYYKNYLPKIMNILAISFAYHRIFSRIYAEIDNLFSGHPESLVVIEQLLYDGERLGGDIIETTEALNKIDVPAILRDGGLMEYLPNSAFSFRPTICLQIKKLNTELIRFIAGTVQDIMANAKQNINLQFEVSREIQEMRLAAIHINKRMLLYYAQQDSDNNKELLVNIKKFFTKTVVDFYQELLNIAHPKLTKYIFGEEIKQLISRQIIELDQHTSKQQINDKLSTITNQLIDKLQQIHNDNKINELSNFKRREEIVDCLRSIILDKQLSKDVREYILSDNFNQTIDEMIDEVAYRLGNAERLNLPPTEGSRERRASLSSSYSSSSIRSEEDYTETLADRIFEQMQELKEGLAYFQRNIIEYCQLIMPSFHPALLKDILEDEKSIKLEKYLLLSKRYFPVFKKLFPDIGGYELSSIAGNCLPSFQQINIATILPIFQKIAVSIIGDEELHDLKIIDNELIKLKHPVRHLSVGFPYSSILQTFPLIFPDEYEHVPKKDAELGLKVFNSKGGYIEERLDNGQIDRQHINSRYLDSDALIRLVNDKKYLTTSTATKEVCDLFATPYQSGWVNFIMHGEIKTDIDVIFKVDKPYPVSILKIYAKAKILPNYKGN